MTETQHIKCNGCIYIISPRKCHKTAHQGHFKCDNCIFHAIIICSFLHRGAKATQSWFHMPFSRLASVIASPVKVGWVPKRTEVKFWM